ncbi:FAD-dependent oxidoreductase [Acerihabitans sp. TG2]|uniref:FAD-dependent oxidoreductase n=1 Tax=Acerihabitans sp. TG2 TaxID=3096008 RepID=UPI002B236977|nr:FAD-dependent oxidoreductase [Acerihabitans sp. TG2]MEA9391414.1 FAD-dependent oxidoreductase [Acerihabitans sp. TG2]
MRTCESAGVGQTPIADNTVLCDVLVVGSGSAALSAALSAAVAGLSVLIVEKAATLGGTSAMSGGAVWVPANHHALSQGVKDSPTEALAYLRATAPEGWHTTEDRLWQQFADSAPEMLHFLEAHTPLRFELTPEADPLMAFVGAKAFGRMLTPAPLRAKVLGKGRWPLRPSPLPQIYTYQEVIREDIYHHPLRVAVKLAPRLLWRWLSGTRTKGAALITGLLAGCLAQGCRVETSARVLDLITDDHGAVTGAWYSHHGSLTRVVADRGVVLASGGFEWDALRRAAHFPGPFDAISSPRTNEGDGHRMAQAVGARLAHMDQANISGSLPTRYEGQPYGLSVFFQYEPNAILVNRHGVRFTNEFAFNLGEALDEREGAAQLPRQLPAWLIADARVLWRAPLLLGYALRRRGWMRAARTPTALALKLGLDPATLEQTLQRFNGFCSRGIDEDFHRHRDGGHGQGDRRFHAGMMKITRAPFIAVPFNRSFLATKGGPRTDEFGRVIHLDGHAIPGLFCAGVAMANPIGTRGVGAGTTLGPNLTWGYICGRTLAGDVAPRSEPSITSLALSAITIKALS